MADETIDVFQLRSSDVRFGLHSEPHMAGAACIPVPENGDTIAVDSRVQFALGVGAVYHVRRWSLPLVVAGNMHFAGLGFMARQAGLWALPCKVRVGSVGSFLSSDEEEGRYVQDNNQYCSRIWFSHKHPL